jgi:hypothetical protein
VLVGRTVGLILLCDHRPFDGHCSARDMTTDENGNRLVSPNLELTYGVHLKAARRHDDMASR